MGFDGDDQQQPMPSLENHIMDPLENTLDYILRFVEGEHAKSDRLPEHDREQILFCVKATLSWKALPRTEEAVTRKIGELNEMMARTLSKI